MTTPAPTRMTADEALHILLEGNQRYVSGQLLHPRQDMQRVVEVAPAQYPIAIILGCADSRVIPEILFDQGIGDLFVLRVAGNIAADNTVIAGIEFAVSVVGVPLIVVLGHQYCAAVAAAVQGDDLPGHLNSLVHAISPAVEKAREQPGDMLDNTIVANVQLMVEKLKSLPPILAERVRAGTLKIVGARYSLETGAIELVT